MTDKELNDLIHENIRHMIKLRKLKIGDVEKAAGVSQGYLAKRKNNAHSMSLKILIPISKALGVDLDELLREKLVWKYPIPAESEEVWHRKADGSAWKLIAMTNSQVVMQYGVDGKGPFKIYSQSSFYDEFERK